MPARLLVAQMKARPLRWAQPDWPGGSTDRRIGSLSVPRCRDLLLTAKTALRQPLKFVLFKVFLESADEAIEPGAGVIV